MMSSISFPPLLLFLIGLSTLFSLWHFSRKSGHGPLPPGPKKLPILGNILDMPSAHEWLTFAKWGEQWGDIVSVTIFGQTLVILNSPKVAADMLDKKSLKYSDRPVLQMAGELVGWKSSLVLLSYGDRFRNYRKLIHQCIGSQSSMKRYVPMEENETRRFLRRVLDNPSDVAKHIRTTAGAIILHVSHGYNVEGPDDPLVHLADTATEQFGAATAPGGFLVDSLPILRYVPSWVPGASFQKKAATWAANLEELMNKSHGYVKQQITQGTAEKSFTSTLLQESDNVSADQEFNIKWSALSLYTGGADTTVAAIYAFFLAMTLYPDVQRKAQAEIDMVIGNDRLPTLEDREHLPYVNALVKEVHRWHTVGPTGIPHRVTVDDVHDGYFIPKGSIVIPNLWRMTHDPQRYADPMSFNPDRFIPSGNKAAEMDPEEIVFGFGRRICPGKLFADTSVFLSCALTLSVFDIAKYADHGVVVEPVVQQLTGTISHPTRFKCAITPRSEQAAALIRDEQA